VEAPGRGQPAEAHGPSWPKLIELTRRLNDALQ